MKVRFKRPLAFALVVLAMCAFTVGTMAAVREPRAGSAGFVRQVAKRMDVSTSQLRTTLRHPPRYHHHRLSKQLLAAYAAARHHRR